MGVGASAGGVEALTRLVSHLPERMDASLLVVMHLSPTVPSVLPDILARAGPLPAAHALDGEVARAGRIYVAPPDRHLLYGAGGRLSLSRGPKENGFRPGIDVLFRSIARHAGHRGTGVVLSGLLWDGAEGLAVLKEAGGTAIVQDPDEALFSSMPATAIARLHADRVLRTREIAGALAEIAASPSGTGREEQDADASPPEDRRMIDRTIDEQLAGRRTGEVSVFTCPECGGSLWESDGETDLRFRCHVGHAYSAQAMESHQHGRVEAALWTAVRALEERASLLRRIGASLERRGLGGAVVADRRREADDVESHAHVLRGLLTGARVRAGADRATADEEADAG